MQKNDQMHGIMEQKKYANQGAQKILKVRFTGNMHIIMTQNKTSYRSYANIARE